MHHLLLSAKSALVAAALAVSVAASAQDVYTMVPEPGEVPELSEMILTIVGTWEQVDRTKKFVFTGPEGVELPKLMSGPIGDGQYSFSFEDDAVITTPGEYSLTIPEGRFGTRGKLCPEATFTWTVVSPSNGDVKDVYTISPAPGKVSKLTEMELKFSGEWAQADRTKKFSFSGPEGVDVPKLLSYSTGSSYMFYFEDDAEITAEGDYTLTIPAGRFSVNGVEGPEVSYTWTVEEGYNPGVQPGSEFPQYTITPEPGVYESLAGGFSLVLDTELAVSVDPERVYLDGPAGAYGIAVEVTEGMPVVTVMPIDYMDTPVELIDKGEYRLIFSAGALTVGESANDEPLVFAYTVGDGGPATGWIGDYTADPADESIVSSLKHIEITFDAFKVTVSDNAAPADFPYLLDNETLSVVAKATVYAEDNVLSISLDREVSTAGYYILVVPAQLIRVNGDKPASDIYLMYEIEGKAPEFEYSFSLSPASGENIGAESDFSIKFSGESLASVANDEFAWGKSYPHFTNDMGAFNPSLLTSADGMTFTFSHQWPFEVAGEYTLVIPAGYFTLTSTSGEVVKSDLIEAVYTVKTTSIDSLNADDMPTATYTLQGVRVNGISLPAGIYIVNGRKTYLK